MCIISTNIHYKHFFENNITMTRKIKNSVEINSLKFYIILLFSKDYKWTLDHFSFFIYIFNYSHYLRK